MPGASEQDLSTGAQTPETGAGMLKPHLDLLLLWASCHYDVAWSFCHYDTVNLFVTSNPKFVLHRMLHAVQLLDSHPLNGPLPPPSHIWGLLLLG